MKIRIVRKTDQWNNEDFIDGPRVFTISHITDGKEQVPYDIHFSDGEGRCWRPSNGMLEVLYLIWGDDSKVWAGRQVELFQDASVKIGRDVVGGIRVRSISHIDKPMSRLITVSRGTKKPYTVQPLTVKAPRDFLAEATAATTADETRRIYVEANNAGADTVTVLDPIKSLGTDRRAAEAALVTSAGVDS